MVQLGTQHIGSFERASAFAKEIVYHGQAVYSLPNAWVGRQFFFYFYYPSFEIGQMGQGMKAKRA